MSPKVLMHGGYRFVILTNDHPPAHVHVKRGEHGAKVQLDPVQILTNWGFNTRELSQILDIVRSHQDELLAEWDKFHPNR